MMMMMIMIASFVDSITTPIKTWFDTLIINHHDKTPNLTVKELGVDSSRVDCIVCLCDVALGERFATLERCQHRFHVECVEAWLKDHPNCPLCRTPISGSEEEKHNHRVYYLKKVYDVVSCYGFHALDTIAGLLTKSFSQGLESSLSESCIYL